MDGKMSHYTKAKEKLSAIFNQSPWLKTDGKAVHLPISGLGKDHQLTWPELYALYRESDSLAPKPKPSDCHQPIKCGWHKVRTEPDINYWSCSTPRCNHMVRAG